MFCIAAVKDKVEISYAIEIFIYLLVRTLIYYIDTDEIPGVFLLLKNHIFIAGSEDTTFIFHV